MVKENVGNRPTQVGKVTVKMAWMCLLDVQPPEGLGAMMVEHVRRKTGLSHDKSQLAVATTLNLLAERVPATENLVAAILTNAHYQHVCVLFFFSLFYMLTQFIVSSGTLNSTIPYHLYLLSFGMANVLWHKYVTLQKYL